MGMSPGGRRAGPVAEINVTPLADVMIVLLIIVMVVVPTFVNDHLPLPRAVRVADHEDGPPVVTIRKDASLLLSGLRVTREELLERLRDRLVAFESDERVVHVRADRDAPFSTVDAVLDVCRRAGADAVTLVAEKKPG